MKAGKIINGFLTIVVVMPIWFYLLYKVLEAVNASQLMWFLYWVYFPVALIVAIIGKIVESNE